MDLEHSEGGRYPHCRCAACLADWAAYNRRLRALRRTQPTPQHAHGRPGTASNHGCTCTACRQANNIRRYRRTHA